MSVDIGNTKKYLIKYVGNVGLILFHKLPYFYGVFLSAKYLARQFETSNVLLMSKHQGIESLPAPCIVDEGIVINPDDIKRLLADLCHVQYIHQIDGREGNKEEGFIQEIFNDRNQSTLVANKKIYINIQSFDYLRLSKTTEGETSFDLIQDNRQLRLIPVCRTVPAETIAKNIDAETIEAMVTEVLTARFDVQLDFDSE